ncbi:ArsR/SmtB family transcription factor [Thermodesulforhabdus norvegica]|uniref:DNA-binding transcriptional regulator, ArsR family n=1 Tax=Thermodesulforhabdus norvegica TaxID=39841 RepID=A0A1I4TNK9_9BACT|nr:metalloregulator ArsR/SmtB family transcription factor [Thermodesulforhabdus norvegica]SFM78215.1 DNA-binding transcriptional regulator, ArsR family [Thermodesulforhabdus norvegica]
MNCCKETEALERLLSPEFFKALTDPNRIAIVCVLSKSQMPLTVTQIAENLPVDISVVSRHLAILRDAGILLARKKGKEVRYSINTGELIRFLRALADAFEACCPRQWPLNLPEERFDNSSKNSEDDDER